jgi:hypothetical protein
VKRCCAACGRAAAGDAPACRACGGKSFFRLRVTRTADPAVLDRWAALVLALAGPGALAGEEQEAAA